MIVILGPTASGKSALAMSVAEKWGAEILSVDSMQVYRGMDIGTAKPTVSERRRVRHHLIDLVDPNESFAVSEFVTRADAAIADAARRGVRLIITGGTPLYYKAMFEGLFEGPGADIAIRTRLNEQPLEQLYDRLTRIDPESASRIHRNDRKRLVRALEVFELTGRPISSFQSDWSRGRMRHPADWYGLMWEKDELNRRINLRVKQMIESGWLDETRDLLQRFGHLSQTASEATGYQELIDVLAGKVSLNDAVEQIKIATRQLARRQMKWFRRWPQVRWLNGSDPLPMLLDSIEKQEKESL